MPKVAWSECDYAVLSTGGRIRLNEQNEYYEPLEQTALLLEQRNDWNDKVRRIVLTTCTTDAGHSIGTVLRLQSYLSMRDKGEWTVVAIASNGVIEGETPKRGFRHLVAK